MGVPNPPQWHPQHPPGYGGQFGPPPVPPRPRRRVWPWLVPTVALIAVAAVAAVTLWGSGESEATASASDAESGDAPAGEGDEGAAEGNWVVHTERPPEEGGITAWPVGDTLVRVAESRVAAFSQTNGELVWEITAPTEGAVFCGPGDRVVNDQVALAYGPGAVGDPVECDTVSVLNVASGELGWAQPVGAPQDTDGARDSVIPEIVGDVVVIAQDQGMVGLGLADGERLWEQEVSYQGERGCGVSDMLATDTQAFIAQDCTLLPNEVQFKTVDPATGETTREQGYESEDPDVRLRFPRLLSADPLIGYMSKGDGILLLALGSEMEPLARIEAGTEEAPEELGLGSGGWGRHLSESEHLPLPMVASEDTLYAVTLPQGDEVGEVVAYDLATGEKRWTSGLPDAHMITPVATEDDELVVVAGPTAENLDLGVTRFDTATGEIVSTERSPALTETGNTPMLTQFRYFWVNDRMHGLRGSPSETDADRFAYGG
ncbi:PQQ-binding-like beta-propeller repeat protein [Streptomyces sedi]|uniref:outer membrane protein assembly factor BamB family protein n=1 Tax=Streptomyces sedi TaxID=555059 RepID=UPI001476AAE2|nr:PQQ-binding-like beta-propeller repeat protein [Streptomyces sedi]